MDNIKILVVEDDPEINRLVYHALEKEGYSVENVFNGKDAVSKLALNSHQMVVLDLMLPLLDGYEVLRIIREKAKIPVLILSAKSEENDKIIGLGLGADDYMTKPFSVDEMVARVKAQLRRYIYYTEKAPENTKSILNHLDLQMDLNTHSVTAGERQTALTAKEFEILRLFLSNPKRVFTKTQIFNAVWGEDCFNDENIIMVHIRRLREKIEPDPSNPKYIQTIWGIGYKLSEV